MKINKKRLVPVGAVLFALALGGLIADIVWTVRQQQLDLITNFYQDHLARPEMRQASQLPAGAFFSKELEALVDSNQQLCDSLSRGDDVCGYGADGDVFLDAQEVPPTLDFERAQFKVTRAGENEVDASFNIHPDMGKGSERQIRFVLVKEDNGWRVDDMLYAQQRSMRQELQKENQAVLARARELADAAGWVYNYLAREDMMDRAVRFIAFPVKVCDEYGVCAAMKRDDARLLHALHALGDGIGEAGFLPRPGEIVAGEGKVVAVHALDFTFQNRAWWVTRIDLRRVSSPP